MSEFQVTFMEQPVVGRACRMIYNGQVGHTAVVTNAGRHPTQASWLRVQTQTGVICQGPVQATAGSSSSRSLGIPARVAIGAGIGILTIALISLMASMISAPSGNSSRPEAQQPQPPKTAVQTPTMWVTAKQIHSSHENNTIRWDAIYLHKRVRVTGIVQRVSKDIADDAYVILESSQGKSDDCVQCSFPDSADAQLVNLSRGDELTVDMTCDGSMLGTIMASDSSVVEVVSWRTVMERGR